MITAGIAAARPMAVASSASAMPGATTARFVVWALEMPMKLFMMPHTVPNRPTKGAVDPIMARTPMPYRAERASARTISAKRDAARAWMPVAALSDDMRTSWIAAAAAGRQLSFGQRPGVGDASQRLAQPPPGQKKVSGLGEENRPSHQGGKCQTDHHRLHEHVGGKEHRPRRQFVRIHASAQ